MVLGELKRPFNATTTEFVHALFCQAAQLVSAAFGAPVKMEFEKVGMELISAEGPRLEKRYNFYSTRWEGSSQAGWVGLSKGHWCKLGSQKCLFIKKFNTKIKTTGLILMVHYHNAHGSAWGSHKQGCSKSVVEASNRSTFRSCWWAWD